MKTVDQIVRGTLSELNIPIHYYMQVLYWAKECVENEVILDSFVTPVRVALTLDANREAVIPDTVDKVINVGYARSGSMVLINKKESIENLGGAAVNSSLSYTVFTNYYYDNFVSGYGESLGKFYGLSSDSGAYYNIKGNTLYGGSYFSQGDTLYLDTISTTAVTTATVVDSYFERMVKLYARFKFLEWNPRTRLTEKQMSSKAFHAERRIARGRAFAKSKEDWLQLFRVNTTMSQKA